MNTEDNFDHRLRRWRKHLGLTQADAAVRLGVTRAYYSQVENGRPPGKTLAAIFETEVNKVIGGSEHLMSSRPKIPLLSWAQAGEAIEFEEVIDWENCIECEHNDPRMVAVTVKGDSMEPRISDGDVLVLLCSHEPRSGDIVVARLRSGGVICKIFNRTGPNGSIVRLSSYNPAYPPIDLTMADFVWVHPVGEQKRLYRR